MKNLLFTSFFILGVSFCNAHDAREYLPRSVECWHLNEVPTEASFLFYKENKIYLHRNDGSITHHSLIEFNEDEQKVLSERIQQIVALNDKQSSSHLPPFNILPAIILFICLLLITLVLWSIYKIFPYKKIALGITSLLAILVLFGFKSRIATILMTDPLFLDAAFAPHQHRVNTSWDNTWFYVESRGIPDHVMMKGIIAWQQQVPLPQCYTGTNSWQIPLYPEFATNPIPVNQMHFLRGAIAFAVNGIPIFNPYTNTGIDAYKDGQLDIFGGHSGRADDYHYHTAPLHLEDSTTFLPIAFSLDGFPVYGTKEPNGSPMQPLDEFHGHMGTDGLYHYHGTKESPYMIAIMKGKVTEDESLQLIPQPRAKGVRPSLTPLSGAVITNFENNALMTGYTLTYTRNNQEYKVDYSWNSTGKYTYNFISPTGTVTEVYNATPPCELSTATKDYAYNQALSVYPNPVSDQIVIEMDPSLTLLNIKEIAFYNMEGKMVYKTSKPVNIIDVSNFAKGIYTIQLKAGKDINISKKITVQ